MELIVRIVKQEALQEREFDNKRTGQREKFATMGFVLQHGSETFYAEMLQEQARKQGVLDPNYYYVANISLEARSWNDQQAVEHFETRVRINKIALL